MMDFEEIYGHVPADLAGWIADLSLAMTIDGADADPDGVQDVIHACDERLIARSPDAGARHVDAAVAAARAAFPGWAATPWAQRRAMLEAFADALWAARAPLALLIGAEAGRPLRRALSEVVFAVGYIRTLAAQTLAEVPYQVAGMQARLVHRPLGVVGAIAPWNGPVILAAAKIANALLSGDTMILRPSPFTPLSALMLGRIGRGIFPRGVFNVITGDADVGAAMTTHPGIAKISFTGSTATGRVIAAAAAPTLKRLTLELGGNDAAIVLPDADIDLLCDTLYRTSFENAGQFCACIKRLYVHEAVRDAVVAGLTQRLAAARIGPCLDPATTMTPVQNRKQFERVWGLIDDAAVRGGTILSGGERLDRGLFIPPTLFMGVGHGVALVDEEQFGPVLPILPFRDVEAALADANSGEMGLGGSVWTADVERGLALAGRMECGTAWVNQHGAFTAALPMPFAKQSGIGMDYAHYGVAEHSRPMLLNVRVPVAG
ncbi:aldehyde dehydrogenase family protein [Sphingobium sufflavum]|uniref:aldehyde dehydrogenase family protein n=1 Tax=Sphingobium sufflavum TaxID=1129547 RepID=UPI001F482D8B|nr:aldehyde dehydrogenase family protein [Sphingobium sufflavum]MCE7796251.1 aldehyde dehydrogenase family protein [Sphingobium sufflavum]